MSMRVLGDKVAVRVVSQVGGTTTKSGLFVPTNNDNKLILSGDVVAKGPDSSVELGEIVHFNKFEGSEISFGDVTLYVVREANVLLVE
jgi:co-chaperonin GroES (HSP10)